MKGIAYPNDAMNYAIGNVTNDKQVIKEGKKNETKHNN